jgi:hypothetical protein
MRLEAGMEMKLFQILISYLFGSLMSNEGL